MAEHRRSSSRRRMEIDVMKLLMSNYEVNLVNDNMQEFDVVFPGPADTPYELGVWSIHVQLPDAYPYKSPSIGFVNRIFHPNIDERSGSVCLDVINQTWSPIYGMINIFESFLPQLLRYPNADDPLNSEASAMMLQNPQAYDLKVREYVRRYAPQPPTRDENEKLNAESAQESEMSELSDDE